MKAIVVTQDSACRINPTNGETIEAFRPSVVTMTEFVTTLVMKSLLKPVGAPLSDLATDAEFFKYYTDSEKNVDLAVSSFMSKFHAEHGVAIPEDFEKAVEAQQLTMRAEEDAARTQKSNVEEAARQQAILDQEQLRIQAEQTKQKEAEAATAAAAASAASAAAAKESPKTGAK